MFRNYLKIALRHLARNKTFSAINILSLSIGMACCFLILIFVKDEFSFDQFQEKKDRIYRLAYSPRVNSGMGELARTPPPVAPLLKDFFGEIESVARMYPAEITVEVREGSQKEQYELDQVYFADSSIVDIFSFELLDGQIKESLNRPFTVVLPESNARLFFGRTDVVGETIWIKGQYPFEITAVVKDYPPNSHMHFDVLVHYNNMGDVEGEVIGKAMMSNLAQNWIITHSYTYVLLNQGESPLAVNDRFKEFLQTHGSERFRNQQEFRLEPMSDFHLHTTLGGLPEPSGNITYVYLFIAIAFITLLIACINFINLSTAGSLGRAREVGVRQVLGAEKKSLVQQFLGESLLVSFLAFLFSLALVSFSLPFLSDLTDRSLQWNLFSDWPLALLFLGLFILTGLLAGIYPAFFVTRFNTVNILKGEKPGGTQGRFSLRKALITTQFLASIALIICTMLMFQQLRHLQDRPLGFNNSQMLIVPLFSESLNAVFGGVDGPLRGTMNTFEDRMLNNPRIEAITASSALPGVGTVRRMVETSEISRDDNMPIACNSVDYDFVQTYGLEIVAGRNFDKAFGSDHQNAYLLNETGIQYLGWKDAEEALGQKIIREGKEGTIVGIFKDFHFESLHQPIDALLLDVSPAIFNAFSLRIQNDQLPQTIAYIESAWKELFPHKVFEYRFLDERINEAYQAEQRMGKMIGYFAFLAILISCFGLYGLVLYSIHQRTKEIGIRKVLGSSVSAIVTLLAKDYLKLIFFALILASLIAWYFMGQWLENFAYRIDIHWSVFVLAGLLVFALALLTISIQSVRAALMNPVEALRDE